MPEIHIHEHTCTIRGDVTDGEVMVGNQTWNGQTLSFIPDRFEVVFRCVSGLWITRYLMVDGPRILKSGEVSARSRTGFCASRLEVEQAPAWVLEFIERHRPERGGNRD